MGLRKQYLPWLACAAIAAAGVPAFAWGNAAAPSSSSDAALPVVDGGIEAYDFGFRDTSGHVTDNVVNITPGGKVTFSYPVKTENTSVHNVVFVDTGPQPTSCDQTVAPPGYPILPT